MVKVSENVVSTNTAYTKSFNDFFNSPRFENIFKTAVLKSIPGNTDQSPHGMAWKMLMEKVFGYTNVKAQGIHQSNPQSGKLIKTGEKTYALYIQENKKAIFEISDNMVSIRTPENKFFDDVSKEEKYIYLFMSLLKK
jgi:hypothetical protein